MGATVLIVSRGFSLLPSHLLLPSPFTVPWLTSLFIPLLLSLLCRSMLTTRGTTQGWKAPRWQPLLLQLVVPQKWQRGEIPELTDFFKKTTVIEDDHQAYHDHGWLTGNLVSFVSEVDVPTVEGYTILCFKFQLATGLGLTPSKFLSSIMNYLECSLVHLNTNAVSELSSFIILYDVSTGMNTSRLPSRAAGRVPSRGRFFWTCMTNPRGSTRLCSLQLSRISGRSHR
jgi:hypothetical protein